MKVNKDKIIGAYIMVNNAPLFKVVNKISVIKFLKAVKPVVEDFEEYKRTCEEKLKPENYEELVEKWQGGDKHCFDEYTKELSKALTDYLKEDVEVDFEPLSEETICELCSENTKSKDIVELIDIIGG